MTVLAHLLRFLLSGAGIWVLTGRLVESVDRVARRLRRSGFTTAVFVLGFVTSISELSVMINATVRGAPQVSAGNLVGASIVVLLGLIPFLAILGNGVRLNNALTGSQLALALSVVALPALCLADGVATRTEGLLCLLVHGTLFYRLCRSDASSVPEVVEDVTEELVDKRPVAASDSVVIVGGAILIFVAGNVLVEETVYFSVVLSVPSSIIGLLVLSIGTNTPELVMAVRSVQKGRKDIAFGNYMGSALTNTLLFGFLALRNGPFAVEKREFVIAGLVMAVGFAAFYVLALSGNRISRREGMMLALVYGAFALIQIRNLMGAGAAP
jgi:cation:H+ antiporter